jgi:phytoene desaturase
MDTVAGVFFPRGGMHAIPRALAGAATKHGVEIRYETGVSRVVTAQGRAAGVITDSGELIAADVVVLNPDLPISYRDLLPDVPTPPRVRRQRYSPSCCVLLAGSNRRYDHIAHHNLHLGGAAWRATFEQVIDRGELMSDPSFLVTSPTRSDPTLAPAGKESYYALFPVPNLDASLDWKTLAPQYRDEMLKTLESHGYEGFGDSMEVSQFTTPDEWEARGMYAGAPFAAAHSFFQTGPFRASNLAPMEGVVFTGSGTQPGVGVPMVLISGRLAAERITGRDLNYRKRSYR